MDLKTFLLARIAEDEEAALAVIAKAAPDEWENPTSWGNFYAEEIAFWGRATPARVLAECAAKRAIIGPAAQEVVTQWQIGGRIHESAIPAEQMERWSDGTGPSMDTLRALAAVYADHTDYRQEWAA